MHPNNKPLELTLYNIAGVLELQNENPFKVRAYRSAARAISALDEDANKLVENGLIKEVKGIGPSIYAKLLEIVEKGESEYLKTIKGNLPVTLFDLLKLPGMGPKRMKVLWDQLKIDSLQTLETACKAGKIAEISGFGKKTQDNFLKEIEEFALTALRRPRDEVLPFAIAYGTFLEQIPGVEKVKIAGSLRREKDTVKDVDIVVSTKEAEQVTAKIIEYSEIGRIIASGKTKTSFRLKNGLQFDTRLVLPEHFICAMMYFTGSKDFNVAVRSAALDKGYSLNEYVLRPLDGSTPPQFSTERELLNFLGMEHVPANQRETTAGIKPWKP